MEIEKVSQTEPVSVTEPVSPVVEPSKEVKPPEPSLEEKIASAVEGAVEKVSRRFQSEKDKAIAQIKREAEERVKLYEDTLSSYETSLTGEGIDPTQVELAKLRAKDKYYNQSEQRRQQQAQQEAYVAKLHTSLTEHLKTLDIDPTDKRIDYAEDAEDYISGRSRFDASVAKIIKENTKATETKTEQRLKDFELKLRKDLGLDSVDTTISGGAIDGIPTDMTKFRDWLNKIPQDEYEKKYASKVTEMRRQGKIK